MPGRRDEQLLAAIKAKYWPRIDRAGRRIKVNDDGTYAAKDGEGKDYAYDPDVLYVGPFLDGLVRLGIFTGVDSKAARHTAKTFFYEVNDKPSFKFTIQRAKTLGAEDWPYTGTKYGEALNLRSISGRGSGESVEPGEVRNSPSVTRSTDDIWETQQGPVVFDPIISVDKRYGLHMLCRGDRVVKTYRVRRGGKMITASETFVLRGQDEGSSYVAPRNASEEKVV